MSLYGRPDAVGHSVRLLALLALAGCESDPRLTVRLGDRPAESRAADFVIGAPDREEATASFDLRQLEHPEVIIHGGRRPPASISLDVILRDGASAPVAEGSFLLPFPGCVVLSFGESGARATTCDGVPLEKPDAVDDPDAGAIDAEIEAEIDAATDAGEVDAGGLDAEPDAGEPLFPYQPSHVDPSLYAYSDLIVSADCTIDSTLRTFTGCSGTMEIATQADGSEIAVVATERFEVQPLRELTLVGSRPFVFLALEEVIIQGEIFASANQDRPGPGSTPERCAGRDGDGGSAVSNKNPGGGGAGHRHEGGGGGASEEIAGGAGGAIAAVLDLRRALLAGCRGGDGASASTAPIGRGGFGGGAIQISATGTITIDGGIHTNGSGGGGGALYEGGGGGGSGGGVLIEAPMIELLSGAAITANGGAGGEGGDSDRAGVPGEDGENSADFALGGTQENGVGGDGGNGGADVEPQPGSMSIEGGGGGGGSSGQIQLRGLCRIVADAQLSPRVACIDL